MATTRKPVPMCCITIGGFFDLVMPTDKGMKLVEILQYSFECKKAYADRSIGYVYVLKDDAPNVEFTTVQPKQIKSRADMERTGTLLLEND